MKGWQLLNYLSTLHVGNSVLWWAGWATEKNFSTLCAEFYQTNACPSWPETLPAPMTYAYLSISRTVTLRLSLLCHLKYREKFYLEK